MKTIERILHMIAVRIRYDMIRGLSAPNPCYIGKEDR